MLERRPQALRSSDFGLIADDPFHYLLRRPYGIVSPTAWQPPCLPQGSWFHKRGEYHREDNERAYTLLMQDYDAWEVEVRALYNQLGRDPADRLKAELRHVLTAHAWWEAASGFRPPSMPGGIHKAIPSPLDTEVYQTAPYKDITLAAQFDGLVLLNGALWVIDYKTTGQPVMERAAAFIHELQPIHYVWILHESLPILIEKYGLPKDTVAGGMMHLMVRNPGISLGDKDRPYTLYSHGKRKKVVGEARPRDGAWGIWVWEEDEMAPVKPVMALPTVEEAEAYLHEACGKKPEKVYDESSEACLENYVARVRERFKTLQGDEAEPPTHLSKIPAKALLTEARLAEYYQLVEQCRPYVAGTTPCYPRTGKGAFVRGERSPYADFYDSAPHMWESLMDKHGLVQIWRD